MSDHKNKLLKRTTVKIVLSNKQNKIVLTFSCFLNKTTLRINYLIHFLFGSVNKSTLFQSEEEYLDKMFFSLSH